MRSGAALRWTWMDPASCRRSVKPLCPWKGIRRLPGDSNPVGFTIRFGAAAGAPLSGRGGRAATPRAKRPHAGATRERDVTMGRRAAAVGSVVFFVVAPGTVAGLIPWWLTGWEMREPLPHWAPMRVLGALLVVAGLVMLIRAFLRFVVEGIGTPAPIAPPERLVVGGP